MTAYSNARPFVVVVSGTSGGGKTTLIRRASEMLAGSRCLFFDDHISVSNTPADVRGWLDSGADPNAFRTPGLRREIQRLLAEEPEMSILLVEDPFGAARDEVSDLVHLAVHLHLPPEIALARRVLRAVEERKSEPVALAEYLAREMGTYLAGGREAYEAADRAAMQTAQLTLDGARGPEELARELVAELNRRTQPVLANEGSDVQTWQIATNDVGTVKIS